MGNGNDGYKYTSSYGSNSSSGYGSSALDDKDVLDYKNNVDPVNMIPAAFEVPGTKLSNLLSVSAENPFFERKATQTVQNLAARTAIYSTGALTEEARDKLLSSTIAQKGLSRVAFFKSIFKGTFSLAHADLAVNLTKDIYNGDWNKATRDTYDEAVETQVMKKVVDPLWKKSGLEKLSDKVGDAAKWMSERTVGKFGVKGKNLSNAFSSAIDYGRSARNTTATNATQATGAADAGGDIANAAGAVDDINIPVQTPASEVAPTPQPVAATTQELSNVKVTANNAESVLADIVEPSEVSSVTNETRGSTSPEPVYSKGVDGGVDVLDAPEPTPKPKANLHDTPKGSSTAETVLKNSDDAANVATESKTVRAPRKTPSTVSNTKVSGNASAADVVTEPSVSSVSEPAPSSVSSMDNIANSADDIAERAVNGGKATTQVAAETGEAVSKVSRLSKVIGGTKTFVRWLGPVGEVLAPVTSAYEANQEYKHAKTNEEKTAALTSGFTSTLITSGVAATGLFATAATTTMLGAGATSTALAIAGTNFWNPAGWAAGIYLLADGATYLATGRGISQRVGDMASGKGFFGYEHGQEAERIAEKKAAEVAMEKKFSAEHNVNIDINNLPKNAKYVESADIKKLQEQLNSKLHTNIAADGKFGPETMRTLVKAGLSYEAADVLGLDYKKIPELEKMAKENNHDYFKALNNTEHFVKAASKSIAHTNKELDSFVDGKLSLDKKYNIDVKEFKHSEIKVAAESTDTGHKKPTVVPVIAEAPTADISKFFHHTK